MRTLGRLIGVALVIVGLTMSDAIKIISQVFTLPERILFGVRLYWQITKRAAE